MSELRCIKCNGTDIAVARDTKSTRHCAYCNISWLPERELGITKPTYHQLESQLAAERAKVERLKKTLNIAANQLEGVSISILQHGQNINVPFFINFHRECAGKAREVLNDLNKEGEK